MSIQFLCAKCGHPFNVEDRFAGRTGHCKHCDHIMPIPTRSTPEGAAATATPDQIAADGGSAGFKLRPIEGLDAPGAPEVQRPRQAPLQVRPLTAADPTVAPVYPPTVADDQPIKVLDPDRLLAKQRHRPFLNPHYETRIARFAARVLRTTRDRLYLLTLALLVMILIGFLFKIKPLIHLGTVGVVLANIAMLVDGVLYLFVLPFRHSLAEGLGTLFPPYAFYYWFRHWGRMRKPVLATVRSFTPILLAGLAYFFYEEAPVIWGGVQQADRAVEKALGVEPGAADPVPQPRQPTVVDQAKQVLGQESNIIQELAQPQ